jgi:hypothetical protein
MTELFDDPILVFLSEQYRQHELFFRAFELKTRLPGPHSKNEHLQKLIQVGAIRKDRMDQYRLTLFGLLSNRQGAPEKPLFRAILRAVKSESSLPGAFKRFSWSTMERHSGYFNGIDFTGGPPEQYVRNGLYLLGLVKDPYAEAGDQWPLDTGRLEEVLDESDVDSFLELVAAGAAPRRTAAAELQNETTALCELESLMGLHPLVVNAVRPHWQPDLTRAVELVVRLVSEVARKRADVQDDDGVRMLRRLLSLDPPKDNAVRLHLNSGDLSPKSAKTDQQAFEAIAVGSQLLRNAAAHSFIDRKVDRDEAIRIMYVVSWVLGMFDNAILVKSG